MVIKNIAAIDLGASSGRVILATYDTQDCSINLREIHRFINVIEEIDNNHCWNLDNLEQQIIIGLTKLDNNNIRLDSIGIDTWGVDYVLLDKKGQLVGPTYSYRDHRTDGVMQKVQQELGTQNIYSKTGIQFLPFNTIYQLKAMVDLKPEWITQVQDFVMIPDYLVYRLTGKLNREYTNATTTQLVNVNTDNWDEQLLDYLDIPKSWFGEIRHPGNKVGYWTAPSGHKVPVVSVASHDTASAVIAAPMVNEDSAYLCSGTWSLMGLDTLEVKTSQQAFDFNITNEGGIDGHYRVLKNIMGLWLFQRVCNEHNIKDIPMLVQQASEQQAFRSLINPNNDRFLNPVSMSDEIRKACKENNQPIPETIAQLTRCIFDSLAMLYHQIFCELGQVHGQPLSMLHVVGGGSQNEFLNQLCADVCSVPVTAGPIEASTLGNVGCQLMALNEITNVEHFRQIVTNSFPLRQFSPQSNNAYQLAWKTFCTLN